MHLFRFNPAFFGITHVFAPKHLFVSLAFALFVQVSYLAWLETSKIQGPVLALDR